MKKNHELFYFFSINDPLHFKHSLNSYLPNITSTQTILAAADKQPDAFVNVAFSQVGLQTLGINDDLGDKLFSHDPYSVNDNPEWEQAFQGNTIHGVFIVGSNKVLHNKSLKSDCSHVEFSIR